MHDSHIEWKTRYRAQQGRSSAAALQHHARVWLGGLRTKGLAVAILDGGAIGQAIGGCQELIEPTREVERRTGIRAAGLPWLRKIFKKAYRR